MTKVIRHSADFRKNDYNSLIGQNEQLKKLLERSRRIDQRKLQNKKAQKMNLDRNTKEEMARKERKFLKRHNLKMKVTE